MNIKVKALEWAEHPSGKPLWRAHAPSIGWYGASAIISPASWQFDGLDETVTHDVADIDAAKAAAQADYERRILSALEPSPDMRDGLPLDRETLGRMVREAWVRWALTQPAPKPSWLVPYDEMSEPDKEADRQIGEAIAKWTMLHHEARNALADPDMREAVEARPGGSTTAFTRDQLARLAFVVFYSPVLCASQNIKAVADEIDCCPGCDHVSSGGTCHVSYRGDYCPNDLAETLRQIGVALYGPGNPSHYVESVFGPDQMPVFRSLTGAKP